jgi:hypothetical protein
MITNSMQQSSSWKANKSSASQEIPRILWKLGGSLPHLQVPTTFPYPEPDQSSPCIRVPLFYVVPNDKFMPDALWDVSPNGKFLWRRIVITSPYKQAGGPPLVGRPRLLIQYIHSYPPHLEAFRPAKTWRSAIRSWQERTYHVMVNATESKIIWNQEVWLSAEFSDEDGTSLKVKLVNELFWQVSKDICII